MRENRFACRSLLASSLAALCLTACSATSSGAAASDTSAVASSGHDLDFRQQPYTQQTSTVNGQSISYRAYEGIVYVRHPVEPRYQTINIYIPEAYFRNQTINGWSAQTAPIFLPNQVGGYMPSEAGKPGARRFGTSPDTGNTPPADAMQRALAQGYVVASPGARGRTSSTGKAPAAIVDLKAAVRYLRANDSAMPGDANKIISNGTSAGGALSVLLGASGNHADYEPYLQALGAAQASDDIFAVSAYCPISILEHADAAYEWQFNGINNYQKMDISMLDYKVERKLVSGTLNAEQIKLSDALKPLFAPYVNSLNLRDARGQPLRLDQNGNGSFRQYVESHLLQAAQAQLDAGKDLSDRGWLTIRNGRAIAADLAAYAQAAGRQKTPPAFDAVDLSSGENQLFGTATTDKRHFTAFGQTHSTAHNATRADPHTVRLMNPMHYITANKHAATTHTTNQTAQHWRIRVGTADRDTSLAIAAILNARLQNAGHQVDFALPWDVPHSGDYDLDELFAWIQRTAQQPKNATR